MKRLTMFVLMLTLSLPLGTLSSHAQSRDQQIQELKQMVEQNRQQNEALMLKIQQMEAEKAATQVQVEELTTKQEDTDLNLYQWRQKTSRNH